MICYSSWKMSQIYEHIDLSYRPYYFCLFCCCICSSKKIKGATTEMFLVNLLSARLLLHCQSSWMKWTKPLATSCHSFCLHAHNFLHCSCINWCVKCLFPPSPHCLDNEQMTNTSWSLITLCLEKNISTFSQCPWKEPPTSTEITHWTPR